MRSLSAATIARAAGAGVLAAATACCGAQPHVLTVAAAASARPAIEALLGDLADSRANFGSSGQLYAQIAQSAPFDVFLSADAVYPQRLVADGLADAADVFTYAHGRLALWTGHRTPIAAADGLAALRAPAVRRIAIARPQLAPYGLAAEQALRAAGVLDAVRDRLVFGENVAEAAHFAASGAVDAALISQSLAQTAALRAAGSSWPVPGDLHRPIVHMGAVLRHAVDPAGARAFVALLLGPRGREVLAAHGLVPPPE